MTTFVSEHLEHWAIQKRRYLHQHPEISGDEYETTTYLKEQLKALDLEILDYKEPGVVARLKGTVGEQTIALRADIDALPIQEEGEKSYMSTVEGVSHMCGHDGHTAVLLAAAKWLSENRDRVCHNLLFIFQSSEEDLPSGARILVEQGVMEGVDAVFGLHLYQPLEKGKIGIAHGPLMSTADDFTITIHGKGGHGSMPHEAVDPTYIASHVIQALQAYLVDKWTPREPSVISIGHLAAGQAYNVIPSTVTIGGTFRTFSEDTRTRVADRMKTVVEGICTSFDGTSTVQIGWGAPAVVNDSGMTDELEKILGETFSKERITEMTPMMGSEDFSHYLEVAKGSYFLIGMGGEKSAYGHHHPKFDIDERVMKDAIESFIQIVLRFNQS
ncbi:LOW QUALITY PROTEIN: N-acetyl-L,L-diaminopimelate deacetylase [Geomicrobium sp. JCM 19037]|nr:LOW QUALITY PROTEIN: N-acetyl-L,L-diaminopimelate deacetylase [Geomicrobium sp. JCM 19037]